MISERAAAAALPPSGFLRNYVATAAKHSDCHLSFHIAGGLAVLTQLAPVNLYALFGGDRVKANFFSLLVGASGSRKGKAIAFAVNLLEDAGVHQTPRPASKESLIESLRANPKTLLVYPEFMEFLTAAQHGPLGQIKALFNDLFDGVEIGSVTVGQQRLKKGNTNIKNPRMSLFAACAPDYLSDHTMRIDWTGGFFSRFFCLCAERERFYDLPNPDWNRREKLKNSLQNLFDTAQDANSAGDYCKGLTSEASLLWKAWARDIDARSGKHRFPAMVIRAQSFAQRIAILLACDYGTALHPGDWYIRKEEIEPAIAITELHIESSNDVALQLFDSPDMRDRHAVLQVIKYNEPTPISDIIRRSQLLKRRVDGIIDTLIAEKAIRALPSTGERYFTRVLNPGAFEVDEADFSKSPM